MANQQSSDGFLHQLWTEYCSGSTVYATRHLVMRKLLPGERGWWFAWIGGVIIACVFANIKSLREWSASPVVISYDTELAPIWAVPFPAVTICPQTKTKVEYMNITELYLEMYNGLELSEQQHRMLRVLMHVCPYMVAWYEAHGALNEYCVPIMKAMALSLDDVFATCKWRNEELPCESLFTQSLTDNGICYTFNAVDAYQLYRTYNLHYDYDYSDAYNYSGDWTLQDGYRFAEDLDSYPYRTCGTGTSSGLYVVLKTRKIDDQSLCNGPLSGFKVVLHSPDDVPLLNTYFYRLPLTSVLKLSVEPTLTFITDDLKKHPYTRRQCYFNGERFLRYFAIYTESNCIHECIANITMRDCGCAKFSMPRGPNVKVCDASSIDCYEESFFKIYNVTDTQQDACECLPACATLQYQVELSQMDFDFGALAHAAGYNEGQLDFITPSILIVSYRSKWTLPLVRRELLGWSDLLAKLGGLFGLMMGASVISLLEIFYYCLIRPWRNEDADDAQRFRHVLPWRP
ncbi:pickpocket protein 28 [Culex quinquefasciatus]|uniref:pickpocket protein 28 n=1 Tax=Culex quinquefasciatus TaxID=7176 RepID=UPI0018E32346|nr:pickpocket protein 28 [Culex quinquefasciatus]